MKRPTAGRGISFSKSPVLKVKLSLWRSKSLLFLLFLLFVVLVGRALWLQKFSTEFLQKQGASRYARTLELSANRGVISDRNGRILAISVPAYDIWAIPDDVKKADGDKLKALVGLLDLPMSELNKKLASDRNFVYLKRQVDLETTDKILALGIAGVETRKGYRRHYPEGEVTAQITGFTNYADVGQDGMELQYQKSLVGTPGSRRVIKDRLGRIVEDLRAVKKPYDGHDLTLSIDSGLQFLTFSKLQQAVEKFGAKSGSAVVLDVHTGEVLALANFPSYNPNNRRELSGPQLRNRAVTDIFEPGSTLKPFTVAAALEIGKITPDTEFLVADKMKIGPATIHDSERHPVESMPVWKIIQKSSNVGTTKIAFELKPQTMWEMFTAVGFGLQPKSGFPGMAAGRVRPYQSWRPIEQATMSYGHGISVSLLQLARGYLIFARDGTILPVSFLKLDQPPIGRRVISPKVAQEVREMMERVVGSDGTARAAIVPGYRAAGKTGTAYTLDNGRYVKKYIGSFVGFAPVSNPRVVVAVMINHPTKNGHYGGTVAAPTFSAIAEAVLRKMNVTPDAQVKNPILGQGKNGKAM